MATSKDTESMFEAQTPIKVKGSILLFYAFDIGDDIELNMIKNKRLIRSHETPLSSYFKNYHVPLSFHMADFINPSSEVDPLRTDCISSKIHHFGVLSFIYKVPFEETFESLKNKLISYHAEYNKKSDEDARLIYKAIMPAIRKPCFFNIKNTYFAVQVNPVKDKISPEDFKERYGNKIASLLRLETENLSDYQKDDILASAIGYYGQDLIIIDTKAAFVYDDEYFEPMEFFESANIQQLELQYFDHILDKKLNYFYSQQSYKVPLKAYIPIIGSRPDLPVVQLAKLRVDISVVTERIENSIKMAGDAYYERLYSILMDRLSLPEWKESINKKLDIIHDIYSVYQDNLNRIRDESLTLVIVALIALEIVLAYFKVH